MKTPIYLDYAATTPLDPRVADIMLKYMTQDGIFGNASSTHVFGKAAKDAIETARKQVADVIHAIPEEIIWTSGATEANNLALKGAAQLYKQKGKHIITVKTEHASVLDCCQQLEKEGFLVTYLTPEPNGVINLSTLKNAIRDDTILVSVMHVNNEIGVIQDIAAIGKLTSERGILLHVDAAQSIGKVAIDVNLMHIDLMSLSAHKVYGPKGIGALYVRRKPRIRVAAQLHGGGQESGMRSGTLPTHQIIGMGEAFALAQAEADKDIKKITHLHEIFLQGLKNSSITRMSDPRYCVPGIINICLKHKTAKQVMQALPQLAISSGSACHAKGDEPSYVLRALGFSAEQASRCIRISFGRFTKEDEIFEAAKLLSRVD